MEGMPKFEDKKIQIETSEHYRNFIPKDFSDDPIRYFEEKGIQIKEGYVKIDEAGRIKEDPTAVVDFPIWENSDGEKMQVVAKIVNTKKSQISKTNNPFHEYRVMQIVRHLNLPSPEPIAKVESGDGYLLIMEKINGLRLVGSDLDYLRQRLSVEEVCGLQQEAESKMEELRTEFLRCGIERKFKLSDMIFDIDFDNPDGPKITKVTPVDWERTKIDEKKLGEFIED